MRTSCQSFPPHFFKWFGTASAHLGTRRNASVKQLLTSASLVLYPLHAHFLLVLNTAA